MASVIYSSGFVGIVIITIYWLIPKISKFKTMETAYPFDSLYASLSKRLPPALSAFLVAGVILISMFAFAGAGIPMFMLILYGILAIAVAIDFEFDKKLSGFRASGIFAVACLSWYFLPTWVTFNVAVIAASSYILTVVSVKNIRTYVWISLGMLVYDVLAVYVGHMGSTTINNAFIPPVLIVVPKDLLNMNMLLPNIRAALGITDVLIAGLAYKYAREHFGNGTIVKVLMVISIFMVFGLSKWTGIVQPALLIIVPMSIVGLYIEKKLDRSRHLC